MEIFMTLHLLFKISQTAYEKMYTTRNYISFDFFSFEASSPKYQLEILAANGICLSDNK